MFDAKTLTGQNLKGPIIGAVQVNRTFRYHKADYECAAWWEDHEAILGVHPVYLGRNYHSPKDLTITAEVRAKVVNDYFPALWGGVAVSNKPYEAKHIGESRVIRTGIDVIDAIQRTGNSPGYDAPGQMDWFIHPSWWKVFADEALANLKDCYRALPDYWQAFEALDESTFVPKLDGRYGFDMEYRSKVGMIAHFGSLLEKWSRRLEKINWHSQYHIPGGKNDTAYQRDNFAKNTGWAKAIPIQVNE
jgi:hypothetical protein